MFITGPPTHSVGGRLVTVAGVCRRLSSSSVYVFNTAHMQRNSPGAARGGPVVIRPVRATPCLSASDKMREYVAFSDVGKCFRVGDDTECD